MQLCSHPMIRLLSSYALGIVALLLLMALLVIGTFYQVDHGIFRAQKLIFSSFFFFYPLERIGFGIPLPGARLLMYVLFFNLLLATLFRLRYRPSVIGVYVVHGGILLLLGGGLITAHFSHEGAMRIREGEASNFSTRYYEKEIVVTRRESDGTEIVTSIRHFERLQAGATLLAGSDDVPMTIELVSLHPDSIAMPDQTGQFADANGINYGHLRKRAIRTVRSADEDAVFLACVVGARIAGQADKVFILSDAAGSNVLQCFYCETVNPSGGEACITCARDFRDVVIRIGDVDYGIRLQNRRDYYPFSIYLTDFQRRTHPGSSIHKSFASQVIFLNPKENIERRARIYMNHPLRHRDFTFYQSSFDENDTVTVFAVVKNAGMVFPYVATIVIAAGLLIQFVTTLVARRRAPATAADV